MAIRRRDGRPAHLSWCGAPTPQTNLFQWCPSSRFWWTFERPRPLCRRQIVDYPGTDLFLFIKPAPQFPDIAGSRGLMKTHTESWKRITGRSLRWCKRKLWDDAVDFGVVELGIFHNSKQSRSLFLSINLALSSALYFKARSSCAVHKVGHICPDFLGQTIVSRFLSKSIG